MKFPTILLLAVVLTCAAAVPALADESCILGDIHMPTCTSAPSSSGDSAVPGEMSTPPAADSVDYGTLAKMALHSLLLY